MTPWFQILVTRIFRFNAQYVINVINEKIEKIIVANWDSIVFETGTQNLQRIPMTDPFKGSFEHVDELINNCETVIELIERVSEPN